MSTMNKAIVLGNLGKDPQTFESKNGNCVCRFNMATHKRQGEEQETTWHRIVLFGKQAELAAKHLKKGSKALVEGRIENDSWEDNDGNKRESYSIVGSRIVFVGSKAA